LELPAGSTVGVGTSERAAVELVAKGETAGMERSEKTGSREARACAGEGISAIEAIPASKVIARNFI
jgi:hypothetical protein